MDGKNGALAGWVACVVVVAVGWLLVGDEGMSAVVAGLVAVSLLLVGVLLVAGRRVESGAPDLIVVPGDSGRPVTAPTAIVKTDGAFERVQINRYGQTRDALAPLASPQAVAQPAGVGMVEALGSMGAAQWYQDQGDRAPWDLDGKPEEPRKAGDGPLLPRRSPRMTDYPLIAEVIGRTSSANEAIRVLWGSKDGKTLGWLTKVRDLYGEQEFVTRGDIIAWELGYSGDAVEDVAERLGVGVDEVQAVFDDR